MPKHNASKTIAETGKRVPKSQSNSAPIAEEGVKDSSDFSKLMSALMGDVLNGRISTDVANATCNAGGKMLKCIEMQYKYGSRTKKAAKLLLG